MSYLTQDYVHNVRITTGSLIASFNSNTIGTSLFTTGGNVYISGGNLGINTTAPSFNLDISGGSRITGQLTTGSHLITNGNLSINNVNITSSSGNFNFNLPTTAGIAGQQLLSGGGTTNPMTWGTPTANVIARSQTSATTILNSATTVLFDTVDSTNTVGATGITYSAGTFTNSNSYTVTLIISYTITLSQGNGGGYRVAQINSGGINYGYAETAVNNSSDYTALTSSCIITLAANGTFILQSFQNSGSTITTIANLTKIQVQSLSGGFAPTQTNVLARYQTGSQSIGASNTTFTYDTIDTTNSFGALPLSYSAGIFTNTGTSPLPITIYWNIQYSTTTTGMIAWIEDNNGIRIAASSSNTNGPLCGSGSIILSVSGTFRIVAYNGSNCTTNVGANTQSRIQIVATTAGASGGTVNATTTSNTLGNITTLTTGNVGINNTAPTYVLDITGTQRIFSNIDGGGNSLFISNAAGGSSAYSPLIIGNDSVNNAVYYLNSTTRIADGGIRAATLRNDGGPLRLQANAGGSTGIWLSTSGNIGISTTNPNSNYVLDVNGNSRIINTTVTSMGTLTVAGPGSSTYLPATTTQGQLASFYGPGGGGIISNFDLSTFVPQPNSTFLPSVRFSMTDLGLANSSFNILTRNATFTNASMSSRIFIDGPGNVGINTTVPSFNLDISGTFRASTNGSAGFVAPHRVVNTGTSNPAVLFLSGPNCATSNTVSLNIGTAESVNNSAVLSLFNAGPGSGSNWIGLGLYGAPGGLFIPGNGYVGINITNPTDSLTIYNGSGRLSVRSTSLNPTFQSIFESNTITQGTFLFTDSSSFKSHLYNQNVAGGTNQPLILQTLVNSTVLGNVGIGTLTPSSLLHVNGVITTTNGNIVTAMNTVDTATGQTSSLITAMSCQLFSASSAGVSTGAVTPTVTTSGTDFGCLYKGTPAQFDFWRTYVNLVAGTYTFRIDVSRTGDRGIVTVVLNGTNVGTVDTYVAGAGRIVSEITSIVVANSGVFKVELQVNTKNGSSSNFHLIWTNASFIRTA